MIVDSHCHYDMPQFNQERFALLAEVKAQGIEKLVVPAVLPESNDTMREKLDFLRYPELLAESGLRAEQLPTIHFAVGIHPTRVWHMQPQAADTWRRRLKKLAGLPGTAAIGETGLDYHLPMTAERLALQHTWFQIQLRLAGELNLPVILHIRMADNDALTVLRQCPLPKGGVVHCFSGDLSLAQQYLALGFKLGIGGALAMPENAALRGAVKAVPLSRLLLETDAPYVKPPWCESRWNTSLILPRLAAQIAELKGISAETVKAATTQNAEELFGI